MSTYFTVNTVSELICAAIGCYCFASTKDKSLHLLWGFVLFTVFVEFAGIYIKINYKYNSWIYNIFLLLQLAFYSTIFFKIFSRYFRPHLFVFSGILMVLLFYGYDLFSHGVMIRHKLSQLAFSLLMISYCLCFFFYLLAKDNFIELSTYAVFWWVAGTLFYFFAVSVINIFSEPLSRLLTGRLEALSYTYRALNVILYSCWSYSFICKRWEIQNLKN